MTAHLRRRWSWLQRRSGAGRAEARGGPGDPPDDSAQILILEIVAWSKKALLSESLGPEISGRVGTAHSLTHDGERSACRNSVF